MVVTAISRLRERVPNATFMIMSYLPASDRKILSDHTVEIADGRPLTLLLLHLPFALADWLFRKLGFRLPDWVFPRAVRSVRQCRALFDVSGVSFDDGRLLVLPYNIVCIWPALLHGIPMIRLSQATGPLQNPINRLSARWLLRACRHSFARGRHTAGFLAAIGIPAERWSLAADVAFGFLPADSITREGEEETATLLRRIAELKKDSDRLVALVPSSVVMNKTCEMGIDYVGVLAQAIAHLGTLGCHVLVLPNATKASASSARNNDFVAIRKLKEAVERDPVLSEIVSWVLFDLNTGGIRKLIACCDLLVTSRFHAMVAGLALGVPTFVVGWGHKYEEVLADFGCENDGIDYSGIRSELLPNIDRMLASLDAKKAQIAQSLPSVIASSQRQFDLVGTIVK